MFLAPVWHMKPSAFCPRLLTSWEEAAIISAQQQLQNPFCIGSLRVKLHGDASSLAERCTSLSDPAVAAGAVVHTVPPVCLYPSSTRSSLAAMPPTKAATHQKWQRAYEDALDSDQWGQARMARLRVAGQLGLSHSVVCR